MENENKYPKNDALAANGNNLPQEDDAKFENESVDPGFGGEEKVKGEEDEREGNIDSNKSIKEMQEDKNNENDAMNYKNDREHGAYNPKNI